MISLSLDLKRHYRVDHFDCKNCLILSDHRECVTLRFIPALIDPRVLFVQD